MISACAKPRVWIFVNGILNWPGAHDGWTDRAVTWTHCRHAHRAEKWEYATGALTRRLKQQDRAQKIATMLGYYERAGFETVLCGHSNGCDIIARVLALRGAESWYFQAPVRSIHLISPATDAAAIGDALAGGDVGRVFLYGSAQDRALQAGAWTRRLFGWARLGYGTLGLEARPLAGFPNVWSFRRDDYGHSTWLQNDEHFDATMTLLHLNDEFPPNQIP